MKLAFLLMSLTGTFCFVPPGKDAMLSGIFLRDLVDRMHAKPLPDISYLDLADGFGDRPDLDEQRIFPDDYEGAEEFNVHPSIRDQELLQHSSLWGNKFMMNGELKNKHGKAESLPAYCNPPNPCPVGFSGEQGCLEHFENTASFSRRYQASQDCMCDTEHMFDCPRMSSAMDDSFDGMDPMEIDRLFADTIKTLPLGPTYQSQNPYLHGEKLPVAAKKGNLRTSLYEN